MTKEKILILITKSNWGGAQRYVYDLSIELKEHTETPYEVEVLAGGNGVLIDRLLEKGVKADGTLPIGRDISISEDIKALWRLYKIIRKRRPGIIHLNSSKIAGLGALAGRLAGVPKIVFTAHGWAFNEDRGLVSKVMIRLSYWIIMFLSHKTITVSESMKEQIINFPFVQNKITVIHNGIENNTLFSKTNSRHELSKINPIFKNSIESHKDKDLVVIGSIGELHKIKGYKYAIEAMGKLNKKVLYVVFSEGEDRSNLEKQIKNLRLEDRVKLCGFVQDVSKYIRAFDIFLLPSLSEALAYVVLEAGIAGLPVVATAVGGVPEIVDDMKSGVLIQARKPEEIASAIEFLIKNKKLQKEYGSELNKKVLEKFSIQQMIEKTVGAYKT